MLKVFSMDIEFTTAAMPLALHWWLLGARIVASRLT